jgi:hypothetical protein
VNLRILNTDIESYKIGNIRIEPFVFYLFLLINLVPVLLSEFFLTVDGPSHVYNANIFNNLIFDRNSILNEYFAINSNINPNIFGHLILSFLLLIFPGVIAEKLLIIAFLIIFPIIFRRVIQLDKEDNVLISYFIFPFTYSYLFLFGFYNFVIGITLLLVFVYYWLRIIKSKISLKEAGFLTLLATLICLSHLFVYVILLLYIFIYIIVAHISDKISFRLQIKYNLIIQLPGLIIVGLFVIYGIKNVFRIQYIEFLDTLLMFLEAAPAKAILLGKEAKFTRFIVVAIIIISLSYFYYRIKYKIKLKLIDYPWNWFVLIIFILSFILPDYLSDSIGLVSHRLQLILFIFLFILLAKVKMQPVVNILILFLILYINLSLVLIYSNTVIKNNPIVKDLQNVERIIEDNKVMVPVINSNNRFYQHISNYIGYDKDVVIMENYEASLGHFPVLWRHESVPNVMIGNLSIREIKSFSWVSNQANRPKYADYVLLISDESKNFIETDLDILEKELSNNYYIKYQAKNGYIKLYCKNNEILLN